MAGFMCAHSLEDYYRQKRDGYIADIVVAPFPQGRAIATKPLAGGEG